VKKSQLGIQLDFGDYHDEESASSEGQRPGQCVQERYAHLKLKLIDKVPVFEMHAPPEALQTRRLLSRFCSFMPRLVVDALPFSNFRSIRQRDS
jgi:hypothetical protein